MKTKSNLFGDVSLTIEDKNHLSLNNIYFGDLSAPFHISLYLTQNCNLNCVHCLSFCGKGYKEYTKDEIDYILNEIINVKPYCICLCGGESLIDKNFEYVVKELTEKKIKVSRVFPLLNFISVVANCYLPHLLCTSSGKISFFYLTQKCKFDII